MRELANQMPSHRVKPTVTKKVKKPPEPEKKQPPPIPAVVVESESGRRSPPQAPATPRKKVTRALFKLGKSIVIFKP